MAEMQSHFDDAMQMVQLRNQFYQKKFYYSLGIFILMLIMAGILIGALVYLIKHPTRPVYFVADEVGRLMYEVPLSQPAMSLEEVTAWTVDAVETANTFNYINYRAQLQGSEKYFTQYGWQEYMKALQASNNLLSLEPRRMIFLAKVVQPPQLITQGILGGAYAYKFEMPVLISYLTPPYDNVLGKSRFDNAFVVDIIVQRQKILSSYKGLGIVQLIMSAPQQVPQRSVMPAE